MSAQKESLQSFNQSRNTMENHHSTNHNGYSQHMSNGNHTHMNGGHGHPQTNNVSGGGTNNSSQQMIDEQMSTTNHHQSSNGILEELRSHATDAPKFNIKDAPKYRIKEEPVVEKYITAMIQGQGTNTKALQIKSKALLDDFITQASSLSGFGASGNAYLVFNGQELTRGTRKTVEQMGIKDGSCIQVCVRTRGG